MTASVFSRSLVKGAAVLLAVGTVSILAPVLAGASNRPTTRIIAVGAENEYANVISQIGGKYVSVSAIMSNPNTDPHSSKRAPACAEVVSAKRSSSFRTASATTPS